jgi:hypothetical protein
MCKWQDREFQWSFFNSSTNIMLYFYCYDSISSSSNLHCVNTLLSNYSTKGFHIFWLTNLFSIWLTHKKTMLEKYDNQMSDRSGFGLVNCGARRILSLFGLNIRKNFFLINKNPGKTHVNLNKAGCSLNICESCSVSNRKSFFVTCFL